jgi:hypothetical protein
MPTLDDVLAWSKQNLANPAVGAALGAGALGTAEHFLGDDEVDETERRRRLYRSLALGAAMGGLAGVGANALKIGPAAPPVPQGNRLRNSVVAPAAGMGVAAVGANRAKNWIESAHLKKTKQPWVGSLPDTHEALKPLQAGAQTLRDWPREEVLARLAKGSNPAPKLTQILEQDDYAKLTPNQRLRLEQQFIEVSKKPTNTAFQELDSLKRQIKDLRGVGHDEAPGTIMEWLRRKSDTPWLRRWGLDFSRNEEAVARNAMNMADDRIRRLSPSVFEQVEAEKFRHVLDNASNDGLFRRSVQQMLDAKARGNAMKWSETLAGQAARRGKVMRILGLLGLGGTAGNLAFGE